MVTVFRDARHIVTAPVADLPRSELVAAMTGEATALRAPRDPNGATSARRRWSSTWPRCRSTACFDDVSFQVRVPARSSASPAPAAAARPRSPRPSSGCARRTPARSRSAAARRGPATSARALAAGVGFVPQDRHHQGLVAGMSIADNATMTIPERLGAAGFLSTRRRDAIASTPDRRPGHQDARPGPARRPGCPAATSRRSSWPGRWPTTRACSSSSRPPPAWTCGPRSSCSARSTQVADAGTGVVVASDELDDLRVCDRVLVMFQGRIVAEMPSGWRDHDLVAAMEGLTVDA